MGKVKDKLLELEEAGVIVWSSEINSYTAAANITDPVPFELAQYLFDLHKKKLSKMLRRSNDI